MNEFVSAIIVNYNRAELVCNCIGAVKKQDYPFIEIIVVDNNSSDNSSEIISQKFPDVKIIKNSKNLGACIARNKAIKLAEGNFLWFLDSDTIAHNKNVVYSMLNLMKDNTIGAVGGESWIEGNFEKGMKKRILLKNGESVWENIKIGEKATTSDYLSTANMMVRKKDILLIGGFNQIYFYLYEDIDLSIKLKKQGLKLISTKNTLSHHLEIQDKARITNFFRINKNRIIFVILNFGVIKFLILPFLDLFYLFNPMKMMILKQKGKSSVSKDSKTNLIKILKIGLDYFKGITFAYIWVLFNLGKILKEKDKNHLDF